MELVYKENTKKDIPAVNSNKNKDSKLHCMYTDADTSTNKMPELKAQIVEHKPSIIAVTEVIPKTTEYQCKKLRSKYQMITMYFQIAYPAKVGGITIQSKGPRS